MGIGFKSRVRYSGGMGGGFDDGLISLGKIDPKDRFFHGNHDDPEKCKAEPNYLGRFGVTKEGVYFVSGAFSVDAFNRTIGISWWNNEQLDHAEFEEALQLYSDTKPEVMATHDCPRSLYPYMLNATNRANGPIYENTTSWFLEKLLDIHKPKVWIFGHWHEHVDTEIGGVRYVCVAELQPVTLEW